MVLFEWSRDKFIDTDTGEFILTDKTFEIYGDYFIHQNSGKELAVYDKKQNELFSIDIEGEIVSRSGKYFCIEIDYIIILHEINFEYERLDVVSGSIEERYVLSENSIAYIKAGYAEVVQDDKIFRVDYPGQSYYLNRFICEDILEFRDYENIYNVYVNYKTNQIVHKTKNNIIYICEDYTVEFNHSSQAISIFRDGKTRLSLSGLNPKFVYENRLYCSSGSGEKKVVIDLDEKLGLIPPK